MGLFYQIVLGGQPGRILAGRYFSGYSRTMLLSREKILEHIKNGTIVIEPFSSKQLKTTSYDVTLGEWYFREKTPGLDSALYNMYDESPANQIWEGPFQAEKVSDLLERMDIDLKNVPKDARTILIGPHETILAHTQEFIGGREVVVAKMHARSSMGRNFLEVCKDAGWGDVGYFNRWTMQITNNSQHYTIPLIVGRRIAQIIFYEVAPLPDSKHDYVGEKGKYQLSQDLEKMKKEWNPHMLLPQMHLDWEVKVTQGELKI